MDSGKQFIVVLFSFISNLIFSQGKIATGTYISENKLESIYIMENNAFGYTRYENDSPYLHKDEPRLKHECGIKGFLVNENGSGTYTILNDSLKLTFTKPRSTSKIDSINVNYLPTEKIENTATITFVQHYNYPAVGKIGIVVTDENNAIVAYSIFDDIFSETIDSNRFPLKLLINYEEKLDLKTAQNYKIDIYINCFETYNIAPLTTKTYFFKSLIYIPE